MSAALIDGAGFLVAALTTHAIVGYTLGAVLFGLPRAGLIGGVVADVDLLVPAAVGAPFVHRGITHAALAAGVVTAVAARWGRATARGVRVGYLSQLLIDATTPVGVPLFFPIVDARAGGDAGLALHSPPAMALLWIGRLAVLRRTERLRLPG